MRKIINKKKIYIVKRKHYLQTYSLDQCVCRTRYNEAIKKKIIFLCLLRPLQMHVHFCETIQKVTRGMKADLVVLRTQYSQFCLNRKKIDICLSINASKNILSINILEIFRKIFNVIIEIYVECIQIAHTHLPKF